MKYKSTGITQQLAEYILKNIKKGYTLDSLKYSLLNQGYSKISVENAMEYANKQLADEIPLIKEKPEITYKIISKSENNSNPQETIIKTNLQKKSFWKKIFR